MFQIILSDRSHETTKLLRRCQGVFSKTPRTLTSPPQFRIDQLSDPEELTTAALYERCSINNNIDRNTMGTVTPAHNCKCCNPDDSYALAPDWKPFPFFYKGNTTCKLKSSKKYFPPDRSNVTCPVTQYISDRRPCGITRQQLDSVEWVSKSVNGTTLSRFLNGSAGYRTYSEDSKMSPGWFYCIQLTNVQKQNTKSATVIPDICLERRSIGNTEKRLKIRHPFLNFETAGKNELL